MKKSKLPYPITLYKVDGKVSEFKIPKNSNLLYEYKKLFDDYIVTKISTIFLIHKNLPSLVVLYVPLSSVDYNISPANQKATEIMHKYHPGEILVNDIVICDEDVFWKEKNKNDTNYGEKCSQSYYLKEIMNQQRKARKTLKGNEEALKLCDMIKDYYKIETLKTYI